LACVFAVQYFHTYIRGCEVVLITDNKSLTFLMKQPNPIPRLQRWILSLDQYRITWMYRKGTANLVADALSRRYQSAEESELAQSELIKLDAVICRTGGHFRLTELKCMIAAMVTRSQSRAARNNISVPPPKIVPEVPMDRVGMDVLKLPMSEEGHNYLLVLQDYLTKYLFAYPIERETAEVIARVLVSDFFKSFGLPRELLTDRGSAFISNLFHELEKLYQIDHLFTTSCHPQTDGMVERANRT
ncbi:MAG: DDE-type integrase/transposase/recombinase, partial [Gammaproteobacteria bacterium]|nr:DDE-type integrase/transposase/recombinase [Gammaproteobacteria bacterium]